MKKTTIETTIGRTQWVACALAWCVYVCVCQSWLQAQEFRIDSHVYSDDSQQPVSHNITLFSKKLVCDFRMSEDAQPHPLEIIVFDPRQRMLVLMDTTRKCRVEIPEMQTVKLLEGLRKETQQNEQTRFLADEEFKEQTDWSTGWVTLSSPTMVYRLKGQPPEDVRQLPVYFDFLNSFTRLNATDPTKLPPFSRMRLNQTIQKLGWLPTEVEVHISSNGFFREPIRAHSKHVVTNGLSKSDLDQIEMAKKYWVLFELVELPQYRGLSKHLITRKFSRRDELAESDKGDLR